MRTANRANTMKRCIHITTILVVMLALWICVGGSLNVVQAATLPAPQISCYAKTYNTVTLKWTAVKGAQSYVVYKYSSAEGKFLRLAVAPASASTYKVTGLTQGTTYQFAVRSAKTTTGTYLSERSNILSVTTYQPKTYRIVPDSLPVNQAMLRYGYYNSLTRQYYMVRSYMEWFEKCGGGKLIFSPGTYTITNTIFVPSNVTLVFEDGVKINKGTDTGCSLEPSRCMFQLVRPSKGHTAGVFGGYDGEKNIAFQGLGNVLIDMKYQDTANCIETGHNQNVTINGIAFKNVKSAHFVEMDATKNAIIENCSFSNIIGDTLREAINLDTPDKITEGFTAIWSKYDCTADYNVLVDNCTFSSMGRSVGTHNYSGGHTHNYIKITNNTMTDMYSYGIGMMNWKYATISNNDIRGSNTAISENRCGILGHGVYNCTIRDNTISLYRWGMLFKPWQGTSPEEIAAYSMIYNYFTSANIGDLQTNYCKTDVIDGRALLYNKDGTIQKILLPILPQ